MKMQQNYFLLVALAILTQVAGHTFRPLKRCEVVDSLKPFDVDQFLGKWYIIEVSSHINRCMTMTFTKINETYLSVTQEREFSVLKAVNVDHKNKYTGKMRIPDTEDSARMTVKWPLHITGFGDFTIMDTDYVNFAVTYECKSYWMLGASESFSILSRESTLDQETVNDMITKLDQLGFDTEPLGAVNQTDCLQDDEGNLNFEIGNNINILGLLSDEQIESIKSPEELAEILNFKVVETNLEDLAKLIDPESEPEPEQEPESSPENESHPKTEKLIDIKSFIDQAKIFFENNFSGWQEDPTTTPGTEEVEPKEEKKSDSQPEVTTDDDTTTT